MTVIIHKAYDGNQCTATTNRNQHRRSYQLSPSKKWKRQ